MGARRVAATPRPRTTNLATIHALAPSARSLLCRPSRDGSRTLGGAVRGVQAQLEFFRSRLIDTIEEKQKKAARARETGSSSYSSDTKQPADGEPPPQRLTLTLT